MKTYAAFAALALAAFSAADDPKFLEWNIRMSTPRLMSGPAVKLINAGRPNHFLGCEVQAAIDVMHAGINLRWWDSPKAFQTEVKFETENPGMMKPGTGPISHFNKVAIKVGPGGKFGGYLQCIDTRFGIDMNFSRLPVYEWHVINLASPADGITGNQRVALLNTKKKAFLVYQGRTIGFELGWWRHFPPLPAAVRAGNNPAYVGYRSNSHELLPFLEQLRKINPSQARFLRNFFGIR